jgi:hypothetical protein
MQNVLHRCLFARTGKPPAGHPSNLPPPWIGPLTLSHSYCVGLGASLRFEATSQTKKATPSPPLSSGAVDRAGEFCPSVARLPRYELGLSIVSSEYTMG